MKSQWYKYNVLMNGKEKKVRGRRSFCDISIKSRPLLFLDSWFLVIVNLLPSPIHSKEYSIKMQSCGYN
jgi:hypothetical protein